MSKDLPMSNLSNVVSLDAVACQVAKFSQLSVSFPHPSLSDAPVLTPRCLYAYMSFNYYHLDNKEPRNPINKTEPPDKESIGLRSNRIALCVNTHCGSYEEKIWD